MPHDATGLLHPGSLHRELVEVMESGGKAHQPRPPSVEFALAVAGMAVGGPQATDIGFFSR